MLEDTCLFSDFQQTSCLNCSLLLIPSDLVILVRTDQRQAALYLNYCVSPCSNYEIPKSQ